MSGEDSRGGQLGPDMFVVVVVVFVFENFFGEKSAKKKN